MTSLKNGFAYTSTNALVSLLIAGLLFCAYLFTASFVFISGDEFFLFDFTESIAKHQSVWRSETAEIEWPGESITEPLLPLLAAPLYWWVNNFDGIGNVHGTLLFNPIVTALTGSLIFLYLRRLNFEQSVSVLSALAFGLTTLAWPYTKTFFREPLSVLLLFACAFFLLNWREAVLHNEWGKRWWAYLTILTGLAGLVSKEVAALGVPLLSALLLIPLLQTRLQSKRDWLIALTIFALATFVLFAVLWIISTTGILGGGRFDFLGRLWQMLVQVPLAWQGVIGFLFSPGKSIFVYSPLLILAIAAPFLSRGSLKWDTSWQLIFALIYILVYSLGRGEVWFGGRNWGPRYMLPIVPFLIISAAPALRALLHSPNWLLKSLVPLLLLSGLGAQIAGTFISVATYDDFLGALIPNGPLTLSLWHPYYSPVLGHWRMIATTPLDFVWIQATGTPLWSYPLLTLAVAAVFSAALYVALTQQLPRRYFFLALIIVPLLTLGVTWFNLRAVYYDRRYQGDNATLHQLNETLKEIEGTPATIFLNNHAYLNFMLNYYKGSLWWYTLELNPKELYKEGQPKYAPSTDPITLANLNARSVVEAFGEANQKTIYLIMEHSLYTPNSPRPLEWWMSSRYHYHSVKEFSTTVRLVRFSSFLAPTPTTAPAHPTQYQFGDSIRLSGWDMQPDNVRFRPGYILNVSTQWRVLTKPNGDYKIALYLMSPSGSIAMQDDSIPLNTFWPTLAWNPNEVIRHNIALTIPQDSSPGFYEIWTVMYGAADLKRLPVQDATGTAIRDHAVLATIEVTR